jgi:hypothetical protein
VGTGLTCRALAHCRSVPEVGGCRFQRQDRLRSSGRQQGSAKGYNPDKRGAPSYHPLLACCTDTKEIPQAWLRTGSAYTSNGIVEFMKQLLAQLPDYHRIVFRADSGFFVGALMDLGRCSRTGAGLGPPRPARGRRPMRSAHRRVTAVFRERRWRHPAVRPDRCAPQFSSRGSPSSLLHLLRGPRAPSVAP